MPAPVFYSVCPFGTASIETGAGNISIASGVATLTVAQTGNIGAGVCIEYNSLRCFIAPNRIGFDSGGTVELLPDTKIEGATSGATGVVRFVEVTSGTWSGGDASGWIYFEKTSGTFQDNEQLNRTKPTSSTNIATVDGTIQGNIGDGNTQFVVKTATGGTPANQAATAVTSVHHEYASLSAFEAGFTDSNHINNTSLVSADVVAHACCYYDHDDQTADVTEITINFGTTDINRYLVIIAISGAAESKNNQRHGGIWDVNKYAIETVSGSNAIENDVAYTKIIGLQIHKSNTSADHISVVFTNQIITMDACILHGNDDDNWYDSGFRSEQGQNGPLTLRNLVVYGCGGGGNAGIRINTSSASGIANIYNCVVSDCVVGVYREDGVVTIKNSVIFNNTDDFDGNLTATYTASDDTQSGVGNIDWDNGSVDWNSNLTAYDGSPPDFSVLDVGADIYNAGTDLSSDGIWRDIVGNERDATTPDIGAFEYVSTTTIKSIADTATGSDAISQILNALTLADTGGGIDSLQGQTSLSVTDTASGADAVPAVSVTLVLADAGVGADAVTVLQDIFKTVIDAGSGVDAIGSLAVNVTVADTGAGADEPTLAMTISVADAGTGTDQVSLLQALVKAVSDAGLGTDTIGSIVVNAPVIDSGQGTDLVASVGALLSVLDTAAGTDFINVVTEAIKTITDTGSGTDLVSGLTVALSLADSGGGTDQPTVGVSLTVSDTVSAADAVSVVKQALRTIADVGAGADSVGSVSVSLAVTDAAQGADIVGAIAAMVGVSDLGSGVDVAVRYETTAKIVSMTITFKRPRMEFTLKQRGMEFDLL